MPLFLITYDLRKPGRNYAAVTELLATTWKAKKLAESVWLAALVGPAPTIRDLIVAQVDPNDRIGVIELKPGSDWAGKNLMPEGLAWLKAYVHK